MACCGQRRQQVSTPAVFVRPANAPAKAAADVPSLVEPPGVMFQYVGKTALTALGLVSGRQYRFGYPGAVLQVDSRDAASLSGVRNLRRV